MPFEQGPKPHTFESCDPTPHFENEEGFTYKFAFELFDTFRTKYLGPMKSILNILCKML